MIELWQGRICLRQLALKEALMNTDTASLAVTILLAIAGLLGKYAYDLRLARRKDALELVNKRLNDFYGPLFVASKAGAITAAALKERLGQGAIFIDRRSPSQHELNEWKVWLPTVFMPLNEFQEQLILKNSHLVRETEFPSCLLHFVAHVAAYKAVLNQWDRGDFTQILSVVDFPEGLEDYASSSFAALKSEQARLIGLTMSPVNAESLSVSTW
ncbi:conserved hypothetical protein [Burkholderiales bacterium 8X]|nr:conserved hypothetical protein [Burkholderiales bacterium 8X]